MEFKDADAAAPSLGIGLVHFPVGSPDDFEPAFKRMVEEKLDAVYIVASTFANAHWEKLAQLALDYRLPAMYGFREFGTSVASYPMEPTCPTVIDAQQPSSTRFSRDRGRRIAGGATDPLRAGHQRENSQSAWRRCAAHATRAGRRGDRIRAAMSAIGPKRTSVSAPHMSAFGGKADMTVCGNPLSRSL